METVVSSIRYHASLCRNGYVGMDGKKGVVIEIYNPATKERVTVNTGIRVRSLDFKYGAVQPTDEMYDVYNKRIRYLLRKLMECEDEMCRNGIAATPAMVRDAVVHNVSGSATVSDFVMSVIMPSTARKDSTKTAYRVLTESLEEFRPHTTIGELSYDIIERYRNWMTGKSLSRNTVISRLKALRCVVNEAIKRRVIRTDNDPFRNVVIGEMKAMREYLTMSEVRRLEHIELTGRMEHVRDAFLFSVYTGLRYGDIRNLESDCLVKTKLTVDQMKTGHVVELPLDKLFGGKPMRLLAKYKTVEQFADIGINSTVNRILKEVGMAAGIKKDIHFHLARKSCGTLLNQYGLKMQEIQYILGHQRLSTTSKHYSFTVYKQVERSLRKAFK